MNYDSSPADSVYALAIVVIKHAVVALDNTSIDALLEIPRSSKSIVFETKRIF
jgi:hypothetical protein